MITVNHTASILRKLKIYKSLGYHNIPTQWVEDCDDVISPILTFAVFPTFKKIVKVTAVYKCHSKSELGKYRPISWWFFRKSHIKGCASANHYYLESTNLISSTQFGFRCSRATQHAVTYFFGHIRLHTDKNMYTGAVFMYLKKAFEMVHHSFIISKLKVTVFTTLKRYGS